MTEFLVKRFVKDYDKTEKMSVRTSYGVLASMVGIFCNVFLFIVKFSVGSLMRSVSVMADGFNNLSDAGSSIISFVGVKMASKPADEEHPFGHGRMEYISALVVSFIVIEVGLSFFKDAIGKIQDPMELQFHLIPTLILILSIGV
ncbi:MAG: cation diffusion facilitator family transporter, partial [Tyzzerella sp.]|nr:cation diffusion facilitator family transporter [Tyzzerella sp.]